MENFLKKYTKTAAPKFSHGNSSFKVGEHTMSESESETSPIKNPSVPNGSNGYRRIYTISDSDDESQDKSNTSEKKKEETANNAVLDSDDERPLKTYCRIKPVVATPKLGVITSAVSLAKSPTSYSSKKRSSSHLKSKGNSKKRRKRYSDDESEGDNEYSNNAFVVDSDMDSDEEISNTMNQSQNKVFEFLNDATDLELSLVPSCTQNRANALVAARPYRNWRHAVEVFKDRGLGLSFLNAISNFLKSRHIVSNLMKKCLNIALETEKVVSEGSSKLSEQPSLLSPNLKLKSYQMVGLNWLVVMHTQNLNVILADEMGLGKTIQVIAFLAHLNEIGSTSNPHLIVAPSSTIENWQIEFTKWCPNLNVVIYHGSPDERRSLRVQWFNEKFVGIDVIITTYNMISSSHEEKKMFKIIPLQYVVFDEAHMLKNMNTQRYSALFNIKAERRILLTGTPLQNNLLELMSLLNFVMPNMFQSKLESIKDFFSKKSKVQLENLPTFEQEQVELAKRIMKPFILRRLKKDVLTDLPPKTSEVILCSMTPEQQKKYDDFKSEMAELAKSGGSDYNYMSCFMQLRKLANHPLTIRSRYGMDNLKEIAKELASDEFYKETNDKYILDDLVFMSDHEIHKLAVEYCSITRFKLKDSQFLVGGKFDKLDEMLPALKMGGHRVIIFSQFVFVLDVLEEYMRIRDHKYLRLDGSTRCFDRQDLIEEYNEDSSIFVFLSTTKAGGVGINLTTADTVVIHDVDFNPYNDKQAEDRCHRLGQTRPVHIMRFISKGTVEELIYKMAQDKLNLEQELTNTGDDENEEKRNVEILLKESLGIE